MTFTSEEEAAIFGKGKTIAYNFVADYFPHFDAQPFKDGLPQKLIEMQGKMAFITRVLL